jgi:pheromone shutdown protein TraB
MSNSFAISVVYFSFFLNRYMVNGLLRLDKPCILAVVGTFHLEGMKYDWEKKTEVPQDSFLNLTSD